jgi:hypothetical protein
VGDRSVDALRVERTEPALQHVDQDPPLRLAQSLLVQVE